MSADPLVGEGLIAAAAAAQAALDAGTPPAGSSEARFIAAMIARVRDLAKRDQSQSAAIVEQESALIKQCGGKDLRTIVATMRRGALDADGTLYQALYRLAVLRMRATKPEALAAEDRR